MYLKEKNRGNVSDGRLDLLVWTLSQMSLEIIIQTLEIFLRMVRGTESYPGTTGTNPNFPKQMETYVHPDKKLRKSQESFPLRQLLRKSYLLSLFIFCLVTTQEQFLIMPLILLYT